MYEKTASRVAKGRRYKAKASPYHAIATLRFVPLPRIKDIEVLLAFLQTNQIIGHGFLCKLLGSRFGLSDRRHAFYLAIVPAHPSRA